MLLFHFPLLLYCASNKLLTISTKNLRRGYLPYATGSIGNSIGSLILGCKARFLHKTIFQNSKLDVELSILRQLGRIFFWWKRVIVGLQRSRRLFCKIIDVGIILLYWKCARVVSRHGRPIARNKAPTGRAYRPRVVTYDPCHLSSSNL